ncbi:MAG: NifB/NifX family molybdenum-iron cluster-binding protein, partial [Candidatus Aenigmatarchaeota archaeon]
VKIMKIAITSTGDSLEDAVSNMFGRCPYFIVVEVEDTEIKDIQSLQNQSKNQRGGAGMSAAQKVGEEEVDALITGSIGPNAFDVLQRLGIDVYSAESSTVKENIELLEEGKLEMVSSPTGRAGRGKGGRGRF